MKEKKIGFIGLGKLGLPVSLAIEKKGFKIFASDPSEKIKEILESKKYPYQEKYIDELLKHTNIKLTTYEDVVKNCEIIFVAVQTPHEKKFEGITRIPKQRKDFNYSYLYSSIRKLSKIIKRQKKIKYVTIISTVLPLTFNNLFKKFHKGNMKISYNPFFIAMGSVIDDFLDPEFILFGSNDIGASLKLKSFYSSINQAVFYDTTIENAELIKVLYNTFISMKLAFINNAMEMCNKIPNSNIDQITNALKLGKKRIISSAYLKGGMGDGGSCHPRDNIAMSYLSKKLKLSFNFFEAMMSQRELSTEKIANFLIKIKKKRKLIILGKSFKANTNMADGSPSVLLTNILKEKKIKAYVWDPFISKEDYKSFLIKNNLKNYDKVIFIGIDHSLFSTMEFDKKSTIVDPWRIVSNNTGKKIISLGTYLNI